VDGIASPGIYCISLLERVSSVKVSLFVGTIFIIGKKLQDGRLV